MELARFFGFLHPALVHFPLVLLIVSVALEAIGFFRRDARLTWAAQITLILGTTATLFAFVAGNFAEIWAARDGIPQDPMEYHELLATITSWTFVFLTAGRLFLGVGTNRVWMGIYLVLAIGACILLGWTGHQGAMLVYQHGAGVKAAGLPPLATHEDMTILLQKQDPDALFYSDKMHHIFGWMVLILSLMLLTDMVSPKWGDRVRRFAPLLLFAGGIYLMIFSDQDAWPLYQVRPFRPWTDKEVLMHKTYAILMMLFGLRGFWQFWKELLSSKKRSGDDTDTKARAKKQQADEARQLHARMMAIFSLVGGALLFTHVHSNAPYANVAAGVYIHHTVMGFIALCIGAVKLTEDALLQRSLRAKQANQILSDRGLTILDNDLSLETLRQQSKSGSSGLRRFLAWAYPLLMLTESIFLINYNEGLPWFLGYRDMVLSAPHNGLIAPLGRHRAEFVFDPDTQRMDIYVLNQGDDKSHPIHPIRMQANVRVGSDTTTVDLLPVGLNTDQSRTDHFYGVAPFLRGVGLFQTAVIVWGVGDGVQNAGRPVEFAPMVADFEPWIDTRWIAPESTAPYVCPMHASEGADKADICRLCGMKLVPRRPARPAGQLADDNYKMGFTIYDATKQRMETPMPGTPVTMEFAPRLSNGQPVQDLDIVHTKKLHLIVVSQDLSFFDHIHPAPLDDGKLQIEYAFPHPGQYLLFADCTPAGDRNQVFRIPVTVAGTAPAPQPLLVTPSEARSFGPYRVALTMTPDPPVVSAGTGQQHSETRLTFTLSKEGKPVSDVEPFLGAGGHCVIVSRDTAQYLHSHPVEMGGKETRYGPSITFHTHFPRKGIYRVWGQFQHEGKPITADFTIEVP